jgi:hypothetical protein
MPLGTRHEETGWLNDQNGERVLRRDAGGTWRLDMGLIMQWRTRKFLGKRIRIIGVRDGFDLLVVTKISAA